jgi:hypothetical protein
MWPLQILSRLLSFLAKAGRPDPLDKDKLLHPWYFIYLLFILWSWGSNPGPSTS